MYKGSKQKIPRHILIKKEPVKTQKELQLVQPNAEQKSKSWEEQNEWTWKTKQSEKNPQKAANKSADNEQT